MNRRELFLGGLGLSSVLLAGRAKAQDAALSLNGALALVPVVVGGTGDPVQFLLDTGAAVTVADGALSAALAIDRFLPKSGPVRAQDTGLSVAGHTAFVRPVLADLSPVSAALGVRVSGLLGSDFLSGFQVRADFAASRLSLSPGGKTMPANGIAMRFDGIPYVQAEVRYGRAATQGEFGLDTGLDSGVKLKDTMTLPLMRLPLRPGTTLTMAGKTNVQAAVVDAVRIGGLDIPNLSAIVTEHDAPRGAGQTYAGTIGAPAFARRVLTLDYPGRWLSISPQLV
jgi:hypothetical protein